MEKCPICSSNNVFMKYPDTLHDDLPAFDYKFTASHNLTYKIMKCRSCGHAYSVLPKTDIWKNYQSVIDHSYLLRQEERIMTFNKITELIHNYVPDGRLLDVGCATGDFLSASQKYYQVEGLEISTWSAEIAKQRGFNIHTYRLSDMPVDEAYDIVTLWGVIEHFEDPSFELKHIYRILKKGGVVCLWTGDIDFLTSKLLGKRWWYIQGQHVQMFSENSLRHLYRQLGFSDVEIGIYPYTTNWQFVYRSLGRYPSLQPFVKPILLNKLMANKSITLSLPGEMFAIFKK